MRVLEVGNTVFRMRVVPDSRRLVIGTVGPYPEAAVTFDVLSLAGGERVRLDVPRAKIDDWWNRAWYGNAIAVHPCGESCYIAGTPPVIRLAERGLRPGRQPGGGRERGRARRGLR
jgi:hypothetical protein